MTHDQIDRLVRQANPVPDPSALEPVDTSVLLDEQRRTEMSTDDRIQVEQQPERPRRGVLVGIAAVIAIVIGALVIFQLTDQAPVADDGPSPDSAAALDTARGFLEAFAIFAPETAASYLTADVLEAEFDGLEGLRLETGFWEATGFKLLVGTCETGEVSPDGIEVRCPYDYHGIRSDEIGLGPYPGSSWSFTIKDGKIVTASNEIRFIENGFSGQMWEPFAAWVATNYPDDVEIMYTNGRTMQRISEESNRLWEQRSKEYIEGAEPAGLTGLPPEGATPSTPENGELVVSMWEHISQRTSLGNGWLYLYADGRLIWLWWDPHPISGWLERRLTPEGVELIRSEMTTTGLFDPDQASQDPPGLAYVQVRDGDQLIAVNGLELRRRLGEVWSWLPASAWDDTQAKAFVPSHYAACMQSDFVDAIDPTEHVSQLPAAARDMLAGLPKLHRNELVKLDPAGMGFLNPAGYCYDLTTDEARELATALTEGGVEMPSGREADLIFIASKPAGDDRSDPVGVNWTLLTLWPMLPHGVPAFTGA
jgi:hypothetical protein